MHCSLLAEEAIHAAIADYAKKNNLHVDGLKSFTNKCSLDVH